MSSDINALKKQVIIHHYDEQSGSYGRRYQGYKKFFYDSLEVKPVIDLLSDKVGGNWLDVGTGEGRFPMASVNLVENIVGIDISKGMIDVARKRNPNPKKISYYQMDLIKTLFPNSAFDAIVCLGTFEYVDDLGPYLKEGYRISKKKAKLVFTCHNDEAIVKTKFNQAYDIYRYNSKSLESILVNNGWNLVQINSIFHISGRWLWILCKGLPTFASKILIKITIKINDSLSNWGPTSLKGRVLMVCAVKNDDL